MKKLLLVVAAFFAMNAFAQEVLVAVAMELLIMVQ